MALWDQVRHFFALQAQQELQVRTEAYPTLTAQIQAVQQVSARPWRAAGLVEALAVPAVLRSVTLISNTIGALNMNAWRNEIMVAPSERPRLIVRPNPLTTAQRFYQRIGYFMSTRGEAWWWVAKRDTDNMALALVPVHPREVTVTENPKDLRFPVIEWRGRKMPNEDMRQIVMFPDESGLRGMGPLQLCGAAVSVAVEAQEWAANFYASGGYPSVILHAEDGFEDEETPALLKDKWTSNPPNTPQVIGGAMNITQLEGNEQGAQMLESRLHQNGEVALMFSIPGTLLEHGVQGGSITYQNVAGEFDKLVKACLWPNYLEAIEQEMTDLLPRTWTARFDVDAFSRPDPKTRMEIHKLAIDAGVYGPLDARVREGLDAGSIETAPVPFAPPQAMPPVYAVRSKPEVRCDGLRLLHKRLVPCGKLLAEAGPFSGTCPRCKKTYEVAA